MLFIFLDFDSIKATGSRGRLRGGRVTRQRNTSLVGSFCFGGETCHLRIDNVIIDDFPGACAVKGNGAVAGYVNRVDHGDVFDALLFRGETLTRHYFIFKFDFLWGIMTNMGKTEGIFLNLQCNCHIVGSIIIKLINHRTLSVHGCQI